MRIFVPLITNETLDLITFNWNNINFNTAIQFFTIVYFSLVDFTSALVLNLSIIRPCFRSLKNNMHIHYLYLSVTHDSNHFHVPMVSWFWRGMLKLEVEKSRIKKYIPFGKNKVKRQRMEKNKKTDQLCKIR